MYVWKSDCAGCVVWSGNAGFERVRARSWMYLFEMRCLRSMIGVTRRDRARNTVIRERTGMNVDLSGRADKSILKWFGHMERIDEVTKKMDEYVKESDE